MRLRVKAGLLLPGLLVACHPSPQVTAPVDAGATIVAPGVISTELPEFAFTLSRDGNEIYFNRTSPDRSQLTIMLSRRVDGQWTAPVVAPFSGTYRDVDPFIAPDGKRLYFSSNRPRTSSQVTSFSTWYVERTKAGWSEPIDPGPPLNSDFSDVFVSVSRAGELYFSSGRRGTQEIFVSRNSGGQWAVPEPLDLGPPAEGAGNPMISPDGRVLLVTARNRDGDTDIWYSCRQGKGWTEIRVLPEPVNSPHMDFGPAIDASGKTLYFTSERPGMVAAQPDSVRPPGDLYQIPLDRAGINCSAP